MEEKTNIYIAIDLKSFYASVECQERGLNPLTTNLVVADSSRTEKTICLAVTPSLKKYGIGGRSRLFEVVQKVKEVNKQRQLKAFNQKFIEESYDDDVLQGNPNYKLSYMIAPPRMALYIEYSARIYQVYLKYIDAHDIHVYSIDEVFADITSYLKKNQMTASEFTKQIIIDILKTTGITATAGIGTNLYLAKIAMDMVAKHNSPDKDGVRIAQLDEFTYRKQLWHHQPLTDFWRVGKGYARRLNRLGVYTMGDIARYSLNYDYELYNEFGINAELLIDHAWGYETCTLEDIKSYIPENQSISNGQSLNMPYSFEKAKIIVKEMVEQLTLDLVAKQLVSNQITLTISYAKENLSIDSIQYQGDITTDYFGCKIPKHAHKSINLGIYTSSLKYIMHKVIKIYDEITNERLLIKKINLTANHVVDEKIAKEREVVEQMNLFDNKDRLDKQKKELEKDRKLQRATLEIKKKFGKNAIIKVLDLEEGATTKTRNKSIGGHKA